MEWTEQGHSSASELWIREIASQHPEQARVDLWIDNQWQKILSEMNKGAIRVRKTPGSGGSTSQSGGTSGSNTASSAETTTNVQPSGHTTRSGSGSGDRNGGEKKPSQKRPPASPEIEQATLTQLLKLLKSNTITAEVLVDNFRILLNTLSPESVNHWVDGATLFYHLMDVMDKKREDTVNQLATILLEEFDAEPVIPCNKKCNQALHKAVDKGFIAIVEKSYPSHQM